MWLFAENSEVIRTKTFSSKGICSGFGALAMYNVQICQECLSLS